MGNTQSQNNSKKRYALATLAIIFAFVLSACTPSDNANSNTNQEDKNSNAEEEGNANNNANANVNENTNAEESEATPTPAPTAMPKASPSATVSQGQVKTIEVSGKPFSFTPSEIRVKKGEKIKIVFKNEEGFHDWVIDEFNARTPQIQAGKTAEVEFTADKIGTFEYYCSVGDHRAKGMKGNLIVE